MDKQKWAKKKVPDCNAWFKGMTAKTMVKMTTIVCKNM